MKVLVILPAFNESLVIGAVLASLPRKINKIPIDYCVVNDGSTDDTLKVVQNLKFPVITHILNRGLGASIKTGMEVARTLGADIMVTFDSDGQHSPRDLKKIIHAQLESNADLVIGSRFLQKQKTPFDRFVLNRLASLLTFIMFGVYSSDSQSGLRVFSKKALKHIDFKGDRMDFSSEILLEAKKHKLKIVETPIKAIYTSYSRKKGQQNFNAVPIFMKFLVRLMR